MTWKPIKTSGSLSSPAPVIGASQPAFTKDWIGRGLEVEEEGSSTVRDTEDRKEGFADETNNFVAKRI